MLYVFLGIVKKDKVKKKEKKKVKMNKKELKEFKVMYFKKVIGKMIDKLIGLVGVNETRKIMEELLGW